MVHANRTVFIMALGVAHASWGQTHTPLGTAFTYQGRLQQEGVPLDGIGTAELRFTLYDGADENAQMIGSPVTKENAEFLDGLFVVELDFGADALDGNARWLELAVAIPPGGAWTPLTPRQPISGVPYALQTRGLFTDELENVGVGSTQPKAKMEVKGTYEDGKGQMILVDKDHDSGEQAAGAAMSGWGKDAESGGSGVGKLWHVGNDEDVEQPGTKKDFKIKNKREAKIKIGTKDREEDLVIDKDGKVGLGTPNPTAKMEIWGKHESTKGQIVIIDEEHPSIDPTPAAVALTGWGSNFGLDEFGKVWHVGNKDDDPEKRKDFSIENKRDGKVKLGTNGRDKDVVIDKDGNVGIGTMSSEMLAGEIARGSTEVNVLNVLAAGIVGIGTALPETMLEVAGEVTIDPPAGEPILTFNSGDLQQAQIRFQIASETFKFTSLNQVAGYSGNYVAPGVGAAVVGGGGGGLAGPNRVTDNGGVVSGGVNNQAGDGLGPTGDKPYAFVGGGAQNRAEGSHSAISGGGANMASGHYSTVGGGESNSAANEHSAIGGGQSNLAGGASSFVGGGESNQALGLAASIGGGESNSTDGAHCYVGGGLNNQANGEAAATGGGSGNAAIGLYSTVAGGLNNIASQGYSAICGGISNSAGLLSSVGGGMNNGASGPVSHIGGGEQNSTSGEYSTVGGGFHNDSNNNYSTVAGGRQNSASGGSSTVAGGENNLATGMGATVSGGFGNVASSFGASVSGGGDNIASSFASVVAGGAQNKAGGSYSFAAGWGATARDATMVSGGDSNGDEGTFVWADSNNFVYAPFISTGPNQFLIRASGGIGINKNNPVAGAFDVSGNGLFSGNVGIGTTNPTAKLHLTGTPGVDGLRLPDGTLLTTAASVSQWNVVAGTNIYNVNTGNVGIGTTTPVQKLSVDPGGAGAIVVGGPFTNTGGRTSLILGVTAASNGYGYVQSVSAGGSTYGNLVLNHEAGNVGVGRQPNSNRFEVEGNASKSTAGDWLANSDARIKTDVQTVTSALDTLDKVRLVDFRYTDEYRATHPTIDDRRYLNVIAQEFAEVFPDHVKSSGEKLPGSDEEILQVDTFPLTIYSAAAVQELHQKVQRQEAEIAALNARLALLEAGQGVHSSQRR